MQDTPETIAVGRLTIALGWVLTALALLSLTLHTWSKKVGGLSINCFDDILVYLSFLISLALMSLTTWAVVVEGQGRHQSAESRSQIELIAKVSYCDGSNNDLSKQTAAVVTFSQRDSMEYCQYISTICCYPIHSQGFRTPYCL